MGLIWRLLMVLSSSGANAGDPTPAGVLQEVRSGAAILIDVREPGEVARGKIEGALTFPSSRLKTPEWEKFLSTLPQKRIYTYCARGRRSGAVVEELRRHGREAVNAGGYDALKAASKPR